MMNELASVTIFAIVQIFNTNTGLRMVNVTGLPDEAACVSYLSDDEDYGGIIITERAVCVDELPSVYAPAFRNESIPGVVYLSMSYLQDGNTWPTRFLFFGVAPEWRSQEGCDLLAASYRELAHGGKIDCIL